MSTNHLIAEDFVSSKELVEEILNHNINDVKLIQNLIEENIKKFSSYRRNQYLMHLNALFGNVMTNELSWRHSNAEEISLSARMITKKLNEKNKQQ
jgi:hypothetical protein